MEAVRVDADAELLAGLRAGDEVAFSTLVGRYHVRMVGLATTFVGRRDLAEDVVQETWLAVLKGMERFEGRAALRTWLFQICANRARSAAVREQRVVPVADLDDDAVPDQFDADGAWITPPRQWAGRLDDDEDDSALIAAVHAAIDALPVQQRQVVTLRDVDGLTAQEVCSVLSISDANQRVLLHRGRARVRAVLDRVVR